MSVRTNFEENILTKQKQDKRNKFNYFKFYLWTLFYLFFKNRLFSHMNSLIMFFPVLCINSESSQKSFAQKTQPSVDGED
jgi:hypothetical protein